MASRPTASDIRIGYQAGSGGVTGGAKEAYGVHLAFGADPATAMVVSWLTRGPVTRPAVRCRAGPGTSGEAVPANTRSYRDVHTGETVFAHHAPLSGLRPATDYAFAVEHDGRPQAADGSFRTAPGSRAAFSFTFFGDQGTDRPYDPFGSPASGYAVAGVERCAPLFALAGGNLSYANQREDPVRTWSDWFTMISASARLRPWLPCVGNHEIERGNGALGLAAYQTYFELPPNGEENYLAGLWYAFTVGAVRFVVLSADDVCYQNSGPIYLRGFSAGRQTAWLARTLKQARADPGIDWIVVAMHHTALSTSADHNDADLGIREAWLPLFDRHAVDLVLYRHEHHYERSHPVRGAVPGSRTLVPRPVAGAAGAGDPDESGGAVVDTSAGTVHLMVGTGGSSSPSADTLLDPPAGRIVVGVRDHEPGRRRRPAVHELEDASWLAFRAPDHPYAFAGFEVDPGEPGGMTRIRVTAYDSSSPDPVPFDQVTLVRPRTAAAPTAFRDEKRSGHAADPNKRHTW